MGQPQGEGVLGAGSWKWAGLVDSGLRLGVAVDKLRLPGRASALGARS